VRATAVLVIAGTTALFSIACPDPGGNDPNVPDKSVAAVTPCPLAEASGCRQPPSYASDIAPLVQRTCMPCHAAGGVAADRRLSTRAELTQLETTVIGQVNGCTMPPADAGPDAMMTPTDRTELEQWFICGAPN
jgi:hypothetical protein